MVSDKSAPIVEKQMTGEVELTKEVDGASFNVEFEDSKSLLWYQNVKLGAFNISSLCSAAKQKVKNLVNHMYLDSGTWTKRESKVTKLICTGTYCEGASASEKLEARKKAKLACQSAQDLDRDSDSRVSFFYQTKPTQAASYSGKVLVPVKGIEPEIENRLETH